MSTNKLNFLTTHPLTSLSITHSLVLPPSSLSSLTQVVELDGVTQVLEAHVWTLCSGSYVANIRVEVFPHADTRRLQVAAKSILAQVMNNINRYGGKTINSKIISNL